MHVNAKKLALAGLLVAFSAVMMILGSVIETNSLFLIGAASFCVGIAIREWGLRMGTGFLIASLLVNFLIAPNKIYCLSYAAMGVYLLLDEWLWERIAEKDELRHRTLFLWIGKYVIFNCVFIPAIVFFQELFLVKEIRGVLLIAVVLAGQVVLFVYDRAYAYFQSMIWGKWRARFLN